MPFRHQGGRDGAKKRQRGIRVSARIRNSGVLGDVSSTIASSALPPGRLIVRVLSGGCEASRATRTPRRALTSSASLARRKKQLREAKFSIDLVDAAKGLAHR
jgi:hypothetical protein